MPESLTNKRSPIAGAQVLRARSASAGRESWRQEEEEAAAASVGQLDFSDEDNTALGVAAGVL